MSAKIEIATLKDFGRIFKRYRTMEQFLDRYPTHDMTPNSTIYALVGTTKQTEEGIPKLAATMTGGGKIVVPKSQQGIYLDDGNIYIIDQTDGFTLPVGRAPPTNPALKIEGIEASKLHAMFKTYEGQVTVKDADSRNGTFVNSQKAQGWTELNNRDIVTFSRDAIFELYMPPELFEFMKKRTFIEGM